MNAPAPPGTYTLSLHDALPISIGGNVLKDAHRRSRRARVVPLGDDLRATDGDPHERAVAGEAERRLVAGLEQLPRMQREVFLLRAQQGFEYEEIAAALGTRSEEHTSELQSPMY